MILYASLLLSLLATALILISLLKQNGSIKAIMLQFDEQNTRTIEKIQLIEEKFSLSEQHIQQIQAQIHRFEQHLFQSLQEQNTKEASRQHEQHLKQQTAIASTLHQQMSEIREQLSHSFKHHADSLSTHVKALNEEVKSNLHLLSETMNKNINEGLDKSTTTFTDIVKRLTIIDEAQKKITELSNNVVSLQDILVDKRSRGAFGEVQLNALITNVLAEKHYAFQHTLSNSKRADCVLFLPEPTGNLVIDSKFPLETFQLMTQRQLTDAEKKKAQTQFKQDIKKHINDIADKYIIENETADGAVMFIPAEAIFAEIHANHPELVTLSHKKKVWLTSPTTLMAILTTAHAVLKDDATKKQVHVVQEHLASLAKDFSRFDKRMQNLARHIDQAQSDVGDVQTSAKKISQRFYKIEQLDIEKEPHIDKLVSIEE